MKTGISKVAGGIALACCVAATSASAATINIPLTDDVQGVRTAWGGATSGETTYLYQIVNMNGKVGVCGGFFAEGTGPIGMLSREQLKTASLFLGETRLRSNLHYFTSLDLDAPVETLTIRCRDVNIPWQDGMESQELELRSNIRNFEF